MQDGSTLHHGDGTGPAGRRARSSSSSTTCRTTRGCRASSRWASPCSSSASARGWRPTVRTRACAQARQKLEHKREPLLDELVALERQHAATDHRRGQVRGQARDARLRNWSASTRSWTSSRRRRCGRERRRRRRPPRRAQASAESASQARSPRVRVTAISQASTSTGSVVEDVTRHFGRRRALSKVRFACDAGHHHRPARARTAQGSRRCSRSWPRSRRPTSGAVRYGAATARERGPRYPRPDRCRSGTTSTCIRNSRRARTCCSSRGCTTCRTCARASTPRSSGRGCATAATTSCRASRAACASALRSSARWSTARGCCCSTSLSPASTTRPRGRWWSGCGTARRGAPSCSSRRTTST